MTRDDSRLEWSPYTFAMFSMAFQLLVLRLSGAVDWPWWVVLLPATMLVTPLILSYVTRLLLVLLLKGRK